MWKGMAASGWGRVGKGGDARVERARAVFIEEGLKGGCSRPSKHSRTRHALLLLFASSLSFLFPLGRCRASQTSNSSRSVNYVTEFRRRDKIPRLIATPVRAPQLRVALEAAVTGTGCSAEIPREIALSWLGIQLNALHGVPRSIARYIREWH